MKIANFKELMSEVTSQQRSSARLLESLEG